MAYELVIRTREPATGEQLATLNAVLRQVQALGLRPWLERRDADAPPAQAMDQGEHFSIVNGGARLEARIVTLESGLAGADLVVANGGTEEELREALKLALALGSAPGMLLYDPQLARELAGSDAESVVASWKKMQAWTMELTGTSEDPRGIALPPPDASESSGGTARHLVIFAAVIFFLFFLLRSNRTAEGQPPELQGKPVERIPANLAPPPPELPRPQAP